MRAPRRQTPGEPYTARVSPSAAFIFSIPLRLPLPRPLERDRRASPRSVGADKVDIRGLVKVRVGVELSGYEVLEFSWGGGTGICEPVNLGILGTDCAYSSSRCLHYLLRLSDNKGKCENKLVIAV